MIENAADVAQSQSAQVARHPSTPKNFALIGAAGFIAPKHLKAIRDTGNRLVAAVDPHDSVGILDSYFPDSRFFTEIERFDRFLEKQRRNPSAKPVDFVSICSPNYLHDAHVRLALRLKAHAICEKPLVINPWNLEQLSELESEQERRVYTVLQLRLHKVVRELKRSFENEANRQRRNICLTYITRRGSWYHSSWKGNMEKSGGVAMNIGIHFFDLLLWLFGSMQRSLVHVSTAAKMSGCLELEWARVQWLLSVDENDLPLHVRQRNGHAWRSITIDGEEIDLSEGFTDLHTEVYRDILAGGGFGIRDAAPGIDLVYNIRNTVPSPANGTAHPLLRQAATR
jgi:UDP-N-acetyl-2-amino-2-deoxyglucuronate dehydrogenase